MSRTYLAIAASIAAEKRDNPERFCIVPRCLWRTVTSKGPNPCRKHPKPLTLEQKLAKSIELRDNDPRWEAVTVNTPVTFDGQPTIWGDLAGNERTECYFDDQGNLVGAFPF